MYVQFGATTGTGLPTGVDDMNVIPYAAGGTISVNSVTVTTTIYLLEHG